MVSPPIPFEPWPVFASDEIAAVTNVLSSGKVNYWTGDEGKSFEREFATYIGTRHAIAVSNGTAALELALKAVGVKEGDEVVVTSRSFIASASSIVMCGAKPIFADVDLHSQNITAETIAAALTPKTKAVIVVHLMGWPCEMDEIMALAREHNLFVIEDCAQAHGATYKGQKVGSIGHINAFSFCQDKIITTGGEGGMITTNDDGLWQRTWSLKDHGKSYDAVYNREHPPGYRWLHESFGTNARMTEMQSAIGRIQLRKLESWIEQRRSNAHTLNRGFSQIPGLLVNEAPEYSHHAYYKYYVVIDGKALRPSISRDDIQLEINNKGIPCFNTYGGEMYKDLAFEKHNLLPDEIAENARHLGNYCLQFLVHPTLNENHMEATIAAVSATMNEATL